MIRLPVGTAINNSDQNDQQESRLEHGEGSQGLYEAARLDQLPLQVPGQRFLQTVRCTLSDEEVRLTRHQAVPEYDLGQMKEPFPEIVTKQLAPWAQGHNTGQVSEPSVGQCVLQAVSCRDAASLQMQMTK